MRFERGVHSLTFRVVLYVSLWAMAGLVVIALVISALYQRDAEKSFRDLLRAHLYNVVNSVSIGKDMALTGNPQLGDLLFSQPDTGWYWVAEPVGTYKGARLSSSSLGITPFPEMPASEVPFGANYERYYQMKDGSGNTVMVAETEVELDDQGHVVRFRVSGNRSVIDESVGAFDRKIYLSLLIFGIGSLMLNAGAILIGLRPLDHVRLALENIRAGEAERLEGRFPSEIQPLANEVNALIDNNRRIVERARMQVGNLAHSLKTPIAVLLNEARAMSPAHGTLVTSQAEAMQSQVQSYLNRARIAAQRETVLTRTDARPVMERLVRVMQKLNREITFSLEFHGDPLILAMEAQDIEETVGNLLENAARFARSSIKVELAAFDEEQAGLRQNWIRITIEDDGPGLDPAQITEALKRGKRLDESRPGSGLGLSIVSEIAGEYQGRFSLSRGASHGLLAELILPAVAREKPKRG
jgi:signal transduction histidine kinase